MTARLARVRVLEFGVGFPPRARSCAAAETIYTLNWLPIGGFVKLEGEDGGDSGDPRSFGRARLPVKLVILVAGVAMNLLLAFVIFTGIALVGEPALGYKLSEVVAGSPAASAGLQPGDTLTSINGVQYSVFDQQLPTDDLRALAGQTVVLGILHADGTSEEVTVTLRVPTSRREGGARASPVSARPGRYRQLRARRGRRRRGDSGRSTAFGMILDGLGKIGRSIVTDPTAAPPASGPVGIAGQLGDILANLGPLYLVYMIGHAVREPGPGEHPAVPAARRRPDADAGPQGAARRQADLAPRGAADVRASASSPCSRFLIWVTVFDVIRQVGGGTP